MVRYDPRDLSRVYLLEAGGAYLEIPYRDLSHRPASLREVQSGARRLRSLGVSPCDERRLFEAIARQREMVENSRNKTLRARRQAPPRLEKSPVFAPSVKQQGVANPEPDHPVDPFPFEIWQE